MTECDTCGEEPRRHPETGAVVGAVSVYVGDGESYWFCSDNCYESHWISNDVDTQQQRLHDVTDNNSKTEGSE